MNSTRATWFMPVLVLAAMAAPARAVTVSFDSGGTGGIDASILDAGGGTADTNYNGYTALKVAGTYAVRSVLEFDVSSITGLYSSIDAITLRLTTSYNAGATTINIHEVVNDWVESQVTWNSQSTGDPWTAPGGDFLATVLASINTSTLASSAVFDGVNEQVTVSLLPGAGNAAARKALIDSWTGGSNEGLLLKASTEPSSFFVGFRDRSRVPAAERPLLTIDYTPTPEPTSLTMLGFGIAALSLIRRRIRRTS